MEKKRCAWPGEDELMIQYHDFEWGVPLHEDKKLFEFFVLDAFQAGLSWKTVLHKRKNFEKAFANFEIKKVAKFGDGEIQRLLEDKGIIRNRQKIHAAIINAQKFLELQKEFGSFDKFIWKFTNHKTVQNSWKSLKELPSKTEISDAMSLELKNRGFKFVGSTICYAFMQASGIVNDHCVDCFRWKELKK